MCMCRKWSDVTITTQILVNLCTNYIDNAALSERSVGQRIGCQTNNITTQLHPGVFVHFEILSAVLIIAILTSFNDMSEVFFIMTFYKKKTVNVFLLGKCYETLKSTSTS